MVETFRGSLKHFLQILQNLEFTESIQNSYCDHRGFDTVNHAGFSFFGIINFDINSEILCLQNSMLLSFETQLSHQKVSVQ